MIIFIAISPSLYEVIVVLQSCPTEETVSDLASSAEFLERCALAARATSLRWNFYHIGLSYNSCSKNDEELPYCFSFFNMK